MVGYAYKLPPLYNPENSAYKMEELSDGTYDAYLVLPDLPRTFIYHTQPNNLSMLSIGTCGNQKLVQSDFLYQNDSLNESVFFDKITHRVSNPFLYADYLCPEQTMVITGVDDINEPHIVIIHPIFPN